MLMEEQVRSDGAMHSSAFLRFVGTAGTQRKRGKIREGGVTNPNSKKDTMTTQASFTLPGTSLTVNRMGYGAMQLAGPGVFGPPRDVNAAVAVLREAVDSGVNHIDTSDYYGPHITNQIIKQALHPYTDDLVIVTKVGARRGSDKSWIPALSRQELIDAVHDNLKNLSLDVLDVVNLRVGGVLAPSEGSIEEPLAALSELKRQGLITSIGLSNVTPTQLGQAQTITEIVCIQNQYNLARRDDDEFIDDLAARGIAYVPFFPLGGFSPLQSSALDSAAASLQATPMQVALAWLLQRAPNMLLIPGTSSVEHLRENLQASKIQIPSEVLADLDAIGRQAKE
ncbi:MAG TPA: aldo/keto reductase family oxidoreductase [Pyrinomonadaceae bacterium]|jgi:aryl-alcohol dehydrogenase-like predicted oxidoreductase